MNEDKERRGDAPQKKQRTISPAIAPFLGGVAAALFGDTAFYMKLYPVGLLCFVILLICVVWIAKAMQQQKREEYDSYRRTRKAISVLSSNVERLETELGLKADKPAKSNIRPGSRQSEAYKAMIGGETHDSRTAD